MNKALNAIKNILTSAIAVIAISMLIFTVISVTFFDRTERSFFGYQAFIVRSDSMSTTDFNAGDLILVKKVDPNSLVEGDIISFISPSEMNYGEVVTHKIRSKTTAENGQPAFITYGTTTGVDDQKPVTYINIIGKHDKTIKGIGKFFSFLKSTPGYISCILVPFILLIAFQILNSVKLMKKFKAEQQEALDKEKEKLLSEKNELAEQRRMIEELLAESKKLKEEKSEEPTV